MRYCAAADDSSFIVNKRDGITHFRGQADKKMIVGRFVVLSAPVLYGFYMYTEMNLEIRQDATEMWYLPMNAEQRTRWNPR
jgi:hypothetical protein